MPTMSWTAENDRVLLLRIIDTSGISVNADQVSKTWPTDAPVRPTARAIKERISKLRNMANMTGAVSISIKGRGGGTGGGTAATPRSRTKAKSTPTSSKRKKVESESEPDADDHETPPKTSAVHTPKNRKLANGRGQPAGFDKQVESPVKVKNETPFNKKSDGGHRSASEFHAFMQDAQPNYTDDFLNANNIYNAMGVNDAFIDPAAAYNALPFVSPGYHLAANTGMMSLNNIPEDFMPIRQDASLSLSPSAGRRGTQRRASKQASEDIAAWMVSEKEKDIEFGDKSEAETEDSGGYVDAED